MNSTLFSFNSQFPTIYILCRMGIFNHIKNGTNYPSKMELITHLLFNLVLYDDDSSLIIEYVV